MNYPIVSTDHEEIAKVAKENGLTVPFLRPEYLSGLFLCKTFQELVSHDSG
jgi:hypothetical protein